jgi:hypothetical protein
MVPVLHTYTDDLTNLARVGFERLRERKHDRTDARREP